MSKLNQIKEILKERRKELEEKFKVREIGVFGSYVKGEEKREAMLIYWFH